MNSLQTYASTQHGAHQAINAGWAIARRLTGEGKTVHIAIGEAEDDRTLRANRFYWGYVLKVISNQAQIGGQQYAAEAWHELFKRKFLGYEIKKYTVAGKRKRQVIRRLKSTADLKVRAFTLYLEQIFAFASVDLGIEWQCLFTPKEVIAGQARGMVIDADTGEILEGV